MTDKSKDSVGIIIKAPSAGPYYCNSDNFRSTLQDKEIRRIHVSSLGSTSYYPNLEKVKKGFNKFETPIGRDHVLLVSLVKDTNAEPSSVYHKPKDLPPLFEMLKRTGVKITSHQTSED